MKKLIGMAMVALLLPMMISCSHGGGGGGGGVTYDNTRASGEYAYVVTVGSSHEWDDGTG